MLTRPTNLVVGAHGLCRPVLGDVAVIEQIAAQAKKASILTGSLSSEAKNAALTAIADALRANQAQIIDANEADLRQAELSWQEFSIQALFTLRPAEPFYEDYKAGGR